MRPRLILLILSHVLALIVSVVSIPLIVVVMNVVHPLYESILRGDEWMMNRHALVTAAILGGTAAALAISSALVDRSGRSIVPTWGPGCGLALLGVASILSLVMTWWSWGSAPDYTPRQILASDALDVLPWITMGSYVGALSFGLVARRFAARSRSLPLWGAALLAPAITSVSIVVLIAQRLP
ncbi:hypothetical protein CLV49_2302 [Labedella gwakjiensis]|uniref:Uncharacterized protein n=1 Tax=Labedella gwakjiensis TaxID=390269 RepID=A0A2P8GXJ3_9MICO|nr:hypothetical protein [Labedella gwakjiensis]PSL38674.1 hypothetical protein CLV49_2302 [Labedella gwakjiensis]RUQ86829.1 hypothetical protein ELQ93_07720 [Labedella gwakjiensis]